jgi:AraC-like DNA-binding protein
MGDGVMTLFFDRVMTNLPDNSSKDKVEVNSSTYMAVVKATEAPSSGGTFPHYQFLIPIYNTPDIIIENKAHHLDPGDIIACNPGQLQRAEETKDPCCNFLALLIDKDYIAELSKALFCSEAPEFENESFNYNSDTEFLINSFINESLLCQPGSELFMQTLSTQIAITLLRSGSHSLPFNQAHTKKMYSDKNSVKQAVDFLSANSNRNITLTELAHEVNYSPYHFLRIFKNSTGRSPSEYLLDIRIEKAKDLMKYTNYSITQVCYMIGFNNTSHFTQAFKRKTGMTPSAYKKNL